MSDAFITAKLNVLLSRGDRFGTIYADPPWQYYNQATRSATINHYYHGELDGELVPGSGMSVDEICALPIRELALPDAHLHLWTTNAFLFECPRIFDAWGFAFRTSFVWVKRHLGIGNYWRNAHEMMLTAIRGNAKRFSDKSLQSWIDCKPGRHSSKPERVRGFIERASPEPRLELFGRSACPGWTVWGNDIPTGLFDSDVVELS